MAYVFEIIFRYVFGFLVTWFGCMIAIFIMRIRINEKRQELRNLKAALTKPESYIWIDVADHLPISSGYYLIEYTFTDHPISRFAGVYRFDAERERFRNVDPLEIKVVRWAELPK